MQKKRKDTLSCKRVAVGSAMTMKVPPFFQASSAPCISSYDSLFLLFLPLRCCCAALLKTEDCVRSFKKCHQTSLREFEKQAGWGLFQAESVNAAKVFLFSRSSKPK
mmetsp:Transcript_45285/g.89244  ORF Transcript_45285/g.89244 Transcript_45285/m.89244 type:complete len:107 (+) Transcript_45285:564-884(+)